MSSYYYDDPVEEPVVKRNKPRAILSSALLLFAGGLFLNTTLAANINIGTGGKVEFGQGMTVTAACSGASVLTATPNSSFVNASGSGSYYFSSVTISGIPAECNGVDFLLSVYDSTTSSALPIFATNKSVARVWNDAGTFKLGTGSVSGASITSNSGSFTVSFTAPVALATKVSRLTLQSTEHVDLVCAIDGMNCSVGDIGPGGGKVFYVDNNGFSAPGTACGDNCHGLEFARTWSWVIGSSGVQTGDNLYQYADLGWGQHTGTYLRTNRVAGSLTNGTGDQAIGAGYMNTQQMALRRPGNSLAPAARRYAGGNNNTLGEWFIPSLYEARELYLSSARNGDVNFELGFYASSSERDDAYFWKIDFRDGSFAIEGRGNWGRVRPVRAF
jgi:hypothetical protein